MSTASRVGWVLMVGLGLAACGDSKLQTDAPEEIREPVAQGHLLVTGQPDLILVALDGLRLDDAWAESEVAPFLSEWMPRAHAPGTMIGSASGLNSAMASLLTGLSAQEHGIASLRDPFGQKLPASAQTLAEDLARQGWQPFASVAAPQLRDELSGFGQGFLEWSAPILDPRAFLGASNIAALSSNQLRGLPDPAAPVFLMLQFSDMAQEGRPNPSAAIARLEHHLAPHLGRLPHVQKALVLGQTDPEGALDEIKSLLGRARGSQPYLAWRRGLREARLGAIDQALAAVLEQLRALGRGRSVLLCVTSLRGAPLAPPQGRVRPAFLPDQMRVVARVGSLDAKTGRTLHGVFDLASLSKYCRGQLFGGGPHEPRAGVLVQDPGLERFGAFGRFFQMEEYRLTEQVLWSAEGELQDLVSNPGPVAVLGSILRQKPLFGWRLGGSPVALDLRWRVMEGTLRSARVQGEGSTASAKGVRGQAHLEPGGQVDMLGGARSQNWVLHVGADTALPHGPWSAGMPALSVTQDPLAWTGEEPHPSLTQGSGWARLELPAGGDFEVWMVRHPVRLREPFPLEWAADQGLQVTQVGSEAIYVQGTGAAVIQLGLPPKRECALSIRLGDRWLAPWEIESAGMKLGSESQVRLLLPPHFGVPDGAGGVSGSGPVHLENLTPQPIFGPLAAAPSEARDFIHSLPPAE
ncbi:MAG TPA: hypothetical protein EYQ25_07275 [Planctomycetes bacterium]|nr:hypothetical protein [Planctomycetota bacterium]